MPILVAVGLLLACGLTAAAFGAVAAARSSGASLSRAAVTPIVEAVRLVRQRRRSTLGSDRLLWRIGGAGLVIVPLIMISVVPLGDHVLFDSVVGVVWFNAADVTVWALVWLAGWGANSAYGLIGGYRFLAQALAYELPLMFALTAPALAAGSLRVGAIVQAQQGLWFVVWMPVAFVVVGIGVAGFSVWGPLGPAVAGDIAGGVLAELSGPDRLLVLAGRYLLMAAGAAFIATLFLGGGSGPVLPEGLWLVVKTLVLLAALVGLGRRLPLVRAERFMEIGWVVLLPLSLLQVLVVGLIAVGRA